MAAVVVAVAQASASAGTSEDPQPVVADEAIAPVAVETVSDEKESAPEASEPATPLLEDAAEATAAQDADAADSDAADSDTAPQPRAQKSAPWRRRTAASGARRSAASASARPAAAAAPAATKVKRPAARRAGRITVAALAVATLVGGTALPALGLIQSNIGTATAASATTDISSQSFTASADAVLPEVTVTGDFSATTPSELSDIRASAAATAKTGIAPIANPGQVIVPMAEGTYEMTDGFGAARPGRSHMGQDYAAPIGTPIYAAADGVVTMSQDSYNGYGVTVQVQHVIDGNAVTTLYGHMNYDSRGVEVGDKVVAGQFLGRVGTTGYTIGSCLHFEVRINGTQINPLPWLDTNLR